MERDLDPATKEQQLRGAFLEPQDAFFVPSSIIDQGLPVDDARRAAPQYGHATSSAGIRPRRPTRPS
jgi:hypothetical protein